MKPVKRNTKSASIAQAKLLLYAKLGWLRGFPLANGQWYAVYAHEKAPEIINLDAKLLSRSTYAFNRLSGDFPKILPKLVGEVATWRQNVNTQLRLLKLSASVRLTEVLILNCGDSPFSIKAQIIAQGLIKRHSKLAGLINLVAWYFYTAPDGFVHALTWMEERHEEITRILEHHTCDQAALLIISLWRCSDNKTKKAISDILHVLSNPLIYLRSLSGEAFNYHQRLCSLPSWESPDIIKPPEVKFPKLLVAWVDSQMGQNRNTRLRALILLGQINLPYHVGAWSVWWQEVEKYYRHAVSVRNQWDTLTNNQMKSIISKFAKRKKNLGAAPSAPGVLGSKLFKFINQYSQADKLENFQFLTRIPSGIATSDHASQDQISRYMTVVASLLAIEYLERAVVVRYLRAFYKYLSCKPPEAVALFNCWKMAYPTIGVSSFFYHSPDYGPLQYLKTTKQFHLYFSCLSEYANRKQACENMTNNTARLATFLSEQQQIVDTSNFILGLGSERYFPEQALSTIWHLCGKNYDSFYAYLAHLEKVENLEHQSILSLTELSGEIKNVDALQNLRSILVYCNTAAIERPLKIANLLLKQRQILPLPLLPTPVNHLDEELMVRYPIRLHPVIQQLVAFTPQESMRQIDNILSKNFPNKQAIVEEIQVIEQRLRAAKGKMQPELRQRLKIRLKNKKQQLQATPQVSPKRLDNLEEKISKAIYERLLEHWHSCLLNTLTAHIKAEPTVQGLPSALYSEKYLEFLLPIMSLEPVMRNLGLELLCKRLGPPPWHHYSHAKNQAFIAKMGHRGVDMQAWLVGIGEIQVQHKGIHLLFSLENDTLEILKMGSYFNTCLSAGSMNFFSVIANAVDVNKRIMYARDQNGKVVGRILLGLTNAGGLVSFNPYCHRGDLDFHRLSSPIVEQLASAMHTVMVRSGEVKTLVASAWYDDGCVDLVQYSLSALHHSDFKTQLLTLPLNEILPLIRTLLQRTTINEPSFITLLNLQEFEQRPQLLEPFLDLITDFEFNAIGEFHRLFLIAEKAGLVSRISDRFGKRFIWCLERYYQQHHYFFHEGFSQAALFAPGKILRLIINYHKSNRTDWYREAEYETIMCAVGCYKRLNRYHHALRLLEYISESAHIKPQGDSPDYIAWSNELALVQQKLGWAGKPSEFV